MGAIEKYQPLDMIHSIDDLARLSLSISKSGFYKDITGPEQVGVKLMIARELGLGITAISFIFPVKGKITLGYQILIALVKRSGKYNLKFLERTETRCEIEWFEDGDSVGRSSFSMEDAKRAGLTRNDTYAKNPVEMLVARAVSSGFNSYAPECAGGGLYTLGELDDVPEPAPARRQRVEQPTTVPSEEVIEAEIVSGAAHVVTATVEDNPNGVDETGESEQAAPDATPVQRARLTIASLSDAEKEAVYEACDALGIKRTLGAIVQRFGDAAYSRSTLLPALAAAVNPPARIEGEVDPDAEVEGAARFQAHLDGERMAAADENIQSVLDRHDRLAAAGGFGES